MSTLPGDESAPLRAVVNIGNPVLAQGPPDDPHGVSVDLARELGRRAARPVELVVVHAARDSVEAIESGRADLGFVAHDPQRAQSLVFTPPYVVIEGCYAVPGSSPLTASGSVDHDGIRIGTKRGSALDLHLRRTITAATVVQVPEHPSPDEAAGLDVISGIRGPLSEVLGLGGGWRLLEPAFMQIRQCVAVRVDVGEDVLAWLTPQLSALLESGFVALALADSGQDPDLAAVPGR